MTNLPCPFFRRLAVLVALAAFLSMRPGAVAENGETDAPDLRVMSFNIRNSGAEDGDNRWEVRADAVLETIREFKPDLLGVQEVLADQHEFLQEQLPDYRMVGVARDDGARLGEWSAILFRADRFEMIDHGDFWLSETPAEVGSRSWDAACVRICTWARLRDRRTNATLLYANTHFDHRSAEARLRSAELLVQHLPKLPDGGGVILTGDFNCTEDDPPYRVLVPSSPATSGFILNDSYRSAHPKR
ncbi:MAG: endonuclease/exonuclease/phosphatase family protein, partial [Chthoniobacteraceae bacterium]